MEILNRKTIQSPAIAEYNAARSAETFARDEIEWTHILKTFVDMQPIETRDLTIIFLLKELGKGKNVEMKRIDKTTKQVFKQGGSCVTITCQDCDNFQVVFKSDRTKRNFTVRENECMMGHFSIKNGLKIPCCAQTHKASTVSIVVVTT